MSLPFTPQQFFDVMGRYNEAVTPLQIGLVLLALSAYAGIWLAFEPPAKTRPA